MGDRQYPFTATFIYTCKKCKRATAKRISFPMRKLTRPDQFGGQRTVGMRILVQGANGSYEQAWAPGRDCEACGRHMIAEQVTGSYRAEVKCDARCTNATGHHCECSCGGRNHGAAYS